MQTPKVSKAVALRGQDLEVAHDKVAEVELQVAGGQHSWILGRQSRCCQEGKQMLQEEVALLGSTYSRCISVYKISRPKVYLEVDED